MTSRTIVERKVILFPFKGLIMLPKSLHVTRVTLMYLEVGPLRSVLKVVMSLGPDIIYNHVLIRRVDQSLVRHRGEILSVHRKTTHEGERLPQKPSFTAP